ncbi:MULTISPECIES: HAD-IA family hydrolase [unclassified Novosphingobium]|uniref:HAD-IA family hydrolase n=1 Tax=unclassified Novosphingobium TaxID=2644732 RepID=UPI000A579439|nr:MULTISPECIES: HAD-IA family hydrolase [unclassified Novosphingobium]MDR6708104.1 phosphoglycolate phosphatase [Novosphingobium sp. 1748]
MTQPIATRLAVFDCDGTLVDGQHDIQAAMVDAFRAQSLTPPSREAVRQIVGLSLPVAMRRLRPDLETEQQAALVEEYKYAYRSARDSGRIGEPLYDGIRGLLDGLRSDGWAMAVATGKSDRGLNHCLAMHGLSDHFVSLQTADRHPSKPHPAMLEAALFEAAAMPQDSVMIGDTSFDMVMARSAGVRALGVAWGYHSVAQLMAAGADAVARDPEHLRELLG